MKFTQFKSQPIFSLYLKMKCVKKSLAICFARVASNPSSKYSVLIRSTCETFCWSVYLWQIVSNLLLNKKNITKILIDSGYLFISIISIFHRVKLMHIYIEIKIKIVHGCWKCETYLRRTSVHPSWSRIDTLDKV